MGIMRPELPELPRQMRDLKMDKRGYPVPWFVDWVNGEIPLHPPPVDDSGRRCRNRVP